MSRRDQAAFVGRGPELAQIAELFVDDPPASVVLVHGPGGIGKSALLREIARRGRTAGWSPVARRGTRPAAGRGRDRGRARTGAQVRTAAGPDRHLRAHGRARRASAPRAAARAARARDRRHRRAAGSRPGLVRRRLGDCHARAGVGPAVAAGGARAAGEPRSRGRRAGWGAGALGRRLAARADARGRRGGRPGLAPERRRRGAAHARAAVGRGRARRPLTATCSASPASRA